MITIMILIGVVFVIIVGAVGVMMTRSSSNSEQASASTESVVSAGNYQLYSQVAYEQALHDGKPVFLFFYAEWCPTCRAQEPDIQSIFAELENDVVGFRVDYDTETQLKKDFHVTLQHTMIILDSKGEESERWIGTVPESTLRKAIIDVN